MRQHRNNILTALALGFSLLTLVACSENEERGSEMVEMRHQKLNLGLVPSMHAEMGGRQNMAANILRVPGDPGNPEVFANPSIVYVVVWATLHDGNTYVQCCKTNVSWAYEGSDADLFGNPAYEGYYSTELPISTPVHCESGRVMVFATATDVTVHGLESLPTTGFFYNDKHEYPNFIYLHEFATKYAGNISTKEAVETVVKNVTFDLPDPASNMERSEIMRNVYSIPFSFTEDGAYRHEYDPRIVLYHVGARFDVDWDVTNETDDRVAYYQVNNLRYAGISAFMPAEKDPTGMGTYSERYTTDEGSWYKHRQVIYVPQMGNTVGAFPLNFTLSNGGTPNTVTANASLPLGNSYFTTWMRYNLTLK